MPVLLRVFSRVLATKPPVLARIGAVGLFVVRVDVAYAAETPPVDSCSPGTGDIACVWRSPEPVVGVCIPVAGICAPVVERSEVGICGGIVRAEASKRDDDDAAR